MESDTSYATNENVTNENATIKGAVNELATNEKTQARRTNTSYVSEASATPDAFNRRASAANVNPALGPLQDLVNGNQWVGDTGFNLMVVPRPKAQFLVMVSPIFETHIFDEVPAPVPNRTMQNGTEQIGAVKYSQIVAENVSKNILHEETGMWLNQTPGTAVDDPTHFGLQMVSGDEALSLVNTNSIVRSGTIPHGNTVQATGVWNKAPFPPPISEITPIVWNVLPYIELSNFQNNGTKLEFLPTFVDGSDPTELQDNYKAQIAESLARIGRSDLSVEDFINPIGFLNSQADNILEITNMPVTTANSRGGVINIPFETKFVAPQDFICTFLIEKISNARWNADIGSATDENATFFQLQYLQSIPLLFPKGYNGKDVLFPHWNLNTLIAI
jgi:hypothetical protein